jgi:hypothetical protein
MEGHSTRTWWWQEDSKDCHLPWGVGNNHTGRDVQLMINCHGLICPVPRWFCSSNIFEVVRVLFLNFGYSPKVVSIYYFYCGKIFKCVSLFILLPIISPCIKTSPYIVEVSSKVYYFSSGEESLWYLQETYDAAYNWGQNQKSVTLYETHR